MLFFAIGELFQQSLFKSRDYPQLICSHWERSKLNNPVWNKVYSRKLFQNVTDEVKQQRIFWGEDQILNLFLLEKCEKVFFVLSHYTAIYPLMVGQKMEKRNNV